TLVVSPNGMPVENGTALLSAMNTISNASPSASNPWLLKLEPGNYDLGSQALTLISFVDLEGSGEGTTTISSTVASPSFPPTQGTLIMAANSEARFVKVVNSGAGYKQIGILVSSGVANARLFHLTANASAPGGSGSYGLFNIGGDVTVQKSTLSASG